MFNLVLTGLLLLVTTVLCVVFVSFIRKLYQISYQFRDFFTKHDDNQPTEAAKFFDMLSHRAGQAIAMEAKTTLMGKASAESRLEQAIAKDIAVDSNPLMGMLAQQFPSLGKRIGKNPAILDFILNRIGNAVAGQGDGSRGSTGSQQGFGAKKGQF